MKLHKWRHFVKGNRGLSLIELMIAASLLVIVLAIGYGFYFFGLTSFTSAESRSDVQQNIRMATDFITREVRFASSMELLDAATVIPAPEHVGDGVHYILLSGNAIEHRAKNVSRIIPGVISGSVSFDLSFAKSGSHDDMLLIQVSGTGSGLQSYQLSSEIFLENLQHFGQNITVSGSDLKAIRFTRHTFVTPVSMSAQPGTVTEQTGFTGTFTLSLLNDTFDENFNSHLSLAGDFSGLSVVSAVKSGASTATVTLSGDLVRGSGSGQIQVLADGLGGNSPLTAVVAVLPAGSKETYTLTVIHSGSGNTTPGPGSHTYNQGDPETLTAAANSPWQFHRWEIGTDTYISPQVNITMDNHITATAIFRLPLTAIPGGSYVHHQGTTYLKLTGANNRVMKLELSGSGTWQNSESRPSKSELEGGNWTNTLRINGVNAYWIRDQHNPTRGIYVKTAGDFDHQPKGNSLGIREALSLDGTLYAYSGSGTLESPYYLNN